MKLGRNKKPVEEKVLEVDASMQGTLIFRDPVNLRINGNFEGNLTTKGNLMVGEHARVKADIIGETIIVAGSIQGNIIASRMLKIEAPASITGDVSTPLISIEEGAIIDGHLKMQQMNNGTGTVSGQHLMSIEDLARYLEVEQGVVNEWVNNGKLPGIKEGDTWKFDQSRIDEWVSAEKLK